MANAKATLLSSHGWLLVTRSKKEDKIRNILIEEHHRGLLVDHDIILALDGWEHAYMIDYGIAKTEYIKILEKNIDWKIASQRYRDSIERESVRIAA